MFNKQRYSMYAFDLCLGKNTKPSSTGPRNMEETLIQSSGYASLPPLTATFWLPSSVSRSDRPTYAKGRWFMFCGRSSSPMGTYRHRNDIHSSRKRRVRATPVASLPQCSSP